MPSFVYANKIFRIPSKKARLKSLLCLIILLDVLENIHHHVNQIKKNKNIIFVSYLNRFNKEKKYLYAKQHYAVFSSRISRTQNDDVLHFHKFNVYHAGISFETYK